MTLRPQALPPVPEVTVAAVQAAFPRGNLSVELRAEFGTLDDDRLFADLYPPQGRPVEVAPWRLAFVMVMQSIEGLTDRQAADAVRRCLDGKYALTLCGHESSVASRKAPGALTSVRVGTWGWHARISSSSSRPAPCMWCG
jgi:transposase